MTPVAVLILLTHLRLLMMAVLVTLKAVPVVKAAGAVKVANKVDNPVRETRWVEETVVGILKRWKRRSSRLKWLSLV